MRIRRLELSGYRSFRRAEWRPGGLNVVTGDPQGRRDLRRALEQLSSAAQGWPDFGEVLTRGGEAPSRNWYGDLTELFWVLECAPLKDERLGFSYELCLERYEGDPGWAIVFERLRRADDFEDHEVLLRDGTSVTWQPPRPKTPRSPGERPPRPDTGAVAEDMSALAVWPRVRKDPRVAPYLEALGSWGFHRPFPTGPDAPARVRPAKKEFHDQLGADAWNLTNLLFSVYDVEELGASLDERLGALLPGYQGLAFSHPEPGALRLQVRWKDRPPTDVKDLPDEVLGLLSVFGALLAPEPPALTWLEAPEEGLLEAWLPAVAALAAEASERTTLVFETTSEALLAALSPHQPRTVTARPGPDGTTTLATE